MTVLTTIITTFLQIWIQFPAVVLIVSVLVALTLVFILLVPTLKYQVPILSTVAALYCFSFDSIIAFIFIIVVVIIIIVMCTIAAITRIVVVVIAIALFCLRLEIQQINKSHFFTILLTIIEFSEIVADTTIEISPGDFILLLWLPNWLILDGFHLICINTWQ